MQTPGLIESVRRETERNLFRARNGIKFASGIGRPKSGLSPKEVVWTREKATMWRYASDRRTGKRPLVIVFSILGRSYVLDLRPDASFIRWVLDAGVDVFLVDFGEPDAIDSTNTLETYVDGYLPGAIRAAQQASGADSVDVMGYCFGGVLATLLAAARPELPIANLAVMASPVDFSESEGAITALKRGNLEIDDIVDHTGNVPAETIHRMFQTLKPTSGISSYATLWERMWSDQFVESFQAMSQWAADQVPFPGGCARQCLELLLRKNLLKEGALPLGSRTVELSAIEMPLLNIYAKHDHLATPAACLRLNDVVGSRDITNLSVPSGHIGLAVSRQAVETTVPGLASWLNERVD